MFWKENHFGIPFNTWLFDRYSHTAPYTTTKDLSRTIVSTQIRLDTFFPWLFIFWKTDHFGSFIAIVTQHHGTPHRIPFVIFSPSTVHHMFMLACQLHSTLLVSSAAKLYHLFFWKKKKKTNFKMQSPLLLEEVLKKRREKEKSRKKNFFNIPPQCFTALQAKMHAPPPGLCVHTCCRAKILFSMHTQLSSPTESKLPVANPYRSGNSQCHTCRPDYTGPSNLGMQSTRYQ